MKWKDSSLNSLFLQIVCVIYLSKKFIVNIKNYNIYICWVKRTFYWLIKIYFDKQFQFNIFRFKMKIFHLKTLHICNTKPLNCSFNKTNRMKVKQTKNEMANLLLNFCLKDKLWNPWQIYGYVSTANIT